MNLWPYTAFRTDCALTSSPFNSKLTEESTLTLRSFNLAAEKLYTWQTLIVYPNQTQVLFLKLCHHFKGIGLIRLQRIYYGLFFNADVCLLYIVLV